MNQPEEVDYIVVGAGSAGCVVAARLSESGVHRVALLEAGGEDRSPWIHMPIGFGKLFDDPRYNWCYESEIEPGLGHSVFQPRGKVIGGTGAINGMIYSRGQREDYDYWRQLGAIGWSYDDVLPYFKKSEDNERGADDFHGVGGPIRVTDIRPHPLSRAFLQGAVAAGFTLNPDVNGATQDGFGYRQITTRNGRRSNSAVAFLKPARRRDNLAVITRATATRILFNGRIATGVEYRRGGETYTVQARREVILCGGAINSPQLLQLSGVGPGALLFGLGVPVIADLPGVGENLQDHLGVELSYRCAQPVTINDMVNNPVTRIAAGLQYALFRKGALATNGSLAGGYIRTDPALAAPDVGIYLTGWARKATGRAQKGLGLHDFSGFSAQSSLLHPDSRGSVRIKSRDSVVAPEIRFNFFTADRDQRAMLAGIRTARRIMAQPAMRAYVAEEILPGAARESDADILAYCRERGRSNFHAACSCKMGVDDNAVVDPRLRVRGFSALRVIDASIMPSIVGGNTNAPTIMIAEKGAAMTLADAR